MFEIKNVMTKNVISVKKHTPISEAIGIMVEKKVTGLPVVDDKMKLVGIITEKDVLMLLYNFGDRPGSVEDFMTRVFKKMLIFAKRLKTAFVFHVLFQQLNFSFGLSKLVRQKWRISEETLVVEYAPDDICSADNSNEFLLGACNYWDSAKMIFKKTFTNVTQAVFQIETGYVPCHKVLNTTRPISEIVQ